MSMSEYSIGLLAVPQGFGLPSVSLQTLQITQTVNLEIVTVYVRQQPTTRWEFSTFPEAIFRVGVKTKQRNM